MATINRHLAAAALGLALFAVATPSFAQRAEQGMGAAREKALRECNAQVNGMSQYTGRSPDHPVSHLHEPARRGGVMAPYIARGRQTLALGIMQQAAEKAKSGASTAPAQIGAFGLSAETRFL